MIRFVISDRVDDYTYEVRVYATRRLYLRACARRRPEEEHHTSQATCFHDRSITIKPDGSEIEHPVQGAIYLHQEMLDGEIVSHEATHAALNLYRKRHRGTAAFGRNLNDDPADHREEELALSVGRMGQDIADQLWDHRLWDAPKRKK